MIGLADVMLKFSRKILRNHKDLAEIRVDRIGDWDVDQPVSASISDRRLRMIDSEGVEPLSMPAGKDDGGYCDWFLPHSFPYRGERILWLEGVFY